MTSVSYRIFEEFVKKNKLTKEFYSIMDDWVFGFSRVYHYKDDNGKVVAVEDEDRNWQIEDQEAENLNTLEFVNNIIKNKQK